MLRDGLNNTYRSLLRGSCAWDKNFFKDFFCALLQNKSTKLNTLTLMEEKEKDEIGRRNTNFLSKESFAWLPQKVEHRCFSLVWEITDDSYICMDEVDIAKQYAKLMEWLSKVRDGSTGDIVNGYIFLAASIEWIPVILRREDLENRSKSEYFWEVIWKLKKHSKGRWIYVLDALYDAKSYFHFLNEETLNYIIRAKKNRVLYTKDGELLWKMKEMPEGIHEVYLKQDGKQKKRGEKTFTKSYLYVKQFPEYTEPMRIYSNTPERDILEYKKRWEIECIFKTMKQEYQMEKIQAHSLQVIENIVATIQMAVAFAHHLYGIQHEAKGKTFFQCDVKLKNRFTKFVKWQSLTINKNAYIKFIAHVIETMYKHKKKKRKKIITSQPHLIPQLCLF